MGAGKGSRETREPTMTYASLAIAAAILAQPAMVLTMVVARAARRS
jgi:hypothetical protein